MVKTKLSYRGRTLLWLLGCCFVVGGCHGRGETPLGPDEVIYTALRSELQKKAGPGVKPEKREPPAGFVDFTGTFKVQGAPTMPAPLTVTRDAQICGAGSVPSPALIVGSGGELANVLVYLETKIQLDDPKWVHEQYDVNKNPKLKTKLFDQKKCVFVDRVFTIRTNQTMIIRNSDPVGHNTALRPSRGARAFDQTIPGGGQVEHSVGKAAPRPFSVSCAIHPWMSAWMITRDDPYFATSGANGAFKITNVPAWADAEKAVTLKFRLWHEGKNVKGSNLVSAKLNGQDVAISNAGQIKVKFVVGQKYNLDVVVNADAFK